MEGYSVTEAASVLGVPTERVWELLARGILSGVPEGDTGMRVFLQPRPAPAAIDEARRSNGHGAASGADAEASPFRELLTEFRGLTERYGQALLALGEARGEVASLRSRVDVLEARMDLRLPFSSPLATEDRPVSASPRRPDDRAAQRGPAAEAIEHDAEPGAEPSSRRKRGRGHFIDEFADALARAEDPSPAVLRDAAAAGAASVVVRHDRDESVAEAEEPEGALPRELPPAEAMAVAEAEPEGVPEREAEQAAPTEPVVELEPAAGPMAEADAEPAALEEPPIVPGSQPPTEASQPPAPAGTVPEPDVAPAPEPAPEPEPEPAPEPEQPPQAEAEAAVSIEPDVEPDVEPGDEAVPEALAEADEPGPQPEPSPEPSPEPGAERDVGPIASAAEPAPPPATEAAIEPAAAVEPGPEPSSGGSWDQERYTARIEEPDWWTPEESEWSERERRLEAATSESDAEASSGDAAASATPSPVSGGQEAAEPAAEPESPAVSAEASTEDGAGATEPVPESAPALADDEKEIAASPMRREPYLGEETMLWFGSRQAAEEPAGWPSEDAAGEMEVASTGHRGWAGPEAGAELPGGQELDEALAGFDALGGQRGLVTPEPGAASVPEPATQPARSPSASRVEPSPSGLVSGELRSPASRAYRRLRRIFPG